MDKVKKIPVANTQLEATPKKKRRGKSLERKRARLGYFFVAPFLIGFALIYLPMIFESIYFSFVEIKPIPNGFESIWVGWENYSYALTDPKAGFVKILFSSILQLLVNIPAIVIFSLFMAIMLNQKMRGRAIFRAIFFIPVIVSTGIIESIDLQNFNAAAQGQITNIGGSVTEGANAGQQIISMIDVASLFSNMKVGTELVKYVVDLVNSVYEIVNRSGVQMLIFLAGLQSISPVIYESAYMEGASSWETFWKITFPMISPMILVNSIYTIIDSFTSQSNAVMKFISTVYEGPSGNVHATAMSWMYFLIVIAILAVVAGILSAYVFYQRRD
ncbi:MAG: sugar ABC transporter permease [Clostridia bacterium]